jgi:flavin-dependent dehydrogenase
MKTIIIIGGGLAGLICAIRLNRKGFSVTLIEKKHYPFHRVCGEYISNEVLPFLKSLEIDLGIYEPSRISQLAISSVSGKLFETSLDLGGFGLSRFALDNFLYQKASREGVNFMLGEKVTNVSFRDNQFEITLPNQIINAELVIGSFGKRSNLDAKLDRKFFHKRSPYLGVKYHVRTDFPIDRIQLDIFEGGYCGIVKIEADRYCLCYLSENKHLKKYGDLSAMEEHILFKNRRIEYYFKNSDFVYDKSEVINEVSFENKSLVQDHILFCGDAAGMITPLCGNGMAIAIHSAKILTDAILLCSDVSNTGQRDKLEWIYTKNWHKQFAYRLATGRMIQRVFGSKKITDFALGGLSRSQRLSNYLISKTHGELF